MLYAVYRKIRQNGPSIKKQKLKIEFQKFFLMEFKVFRKPKNRNNKERYGIP
jgi:hypothetical protein